VTDDIMNLTLWMTTGLLTVAALTGGISKTFVSKDQLAHVPGGGWTNDHPGGFVKTLGVLELLAVAGLTLPAVVDVVPVLVPITAACWILLMVGATITHLRRGERAFVALNLVYLALAAFIVWGRFGPHSFS
jgi:hypothetical protein